jgi:hypothetical protein
MGFVYELLRLARGDTEVDPDLELELESVGGVRGFVTFLLIFLTSMLISSATFSWAFPVDPLLRSAMMIAMSADGNPIQ